MTILINTLGCLQDRNGELLQNQNGIEMTEAADYILYVEKKN